jgi:CheY-like chemotaxis protein/anti-sigma regulatory factor (Ser/Thr protein kinase)
MSEDIAERLRAREEFLRHMSHELRTPLNGVIGMLGLLSRTRMDGAQRSYLQSARESADHLLGLVNDILDFARIEAGRLELESAAVDIERLVQGVAELLSPRAHDKAIEIAWVVDADVPDVLADDGRLRQILFNLAGNAVKFTGRGGVLLSVETFDATERDIGLRFLVRDTGPGIPDAARERIFEEFGHAHPADAIRYGGAGLGLAVVKRLVEAMGGRLLLDSVLGEGSIFGFEARFVVSAAAARPGRLDGVKVAIVSDSDEVREAAARQVQACGGEIYLAKTLDQAAARTSDSVPILLDPGANAARVVQKPKGHKGIVLLRPEERELIEAWRGAGWTGYLIKPLRRASLAARVEAAMAQGVGHPASPHTDDERIAPATIAGVRVLLAEDNPVNAILIRSLLRKEGCTVELAGSGDEALIALQRSRYDVVLMDMRMPGLDGPSATRALRARGDETPVIALTANAFEEDRRACLEAGMNAFFSKPVDPTVLRNAVARWTNRETRAKLAS